MIMKKSCVLVFCLLTVVFFSQNAVCEADDVIVDGQSVTIPGGDYNYITVKNNGTLTITGNTTAKRGST